MFKRRNNLYSKDIFGTNFGFGILAFTIGPLSGCESDEGEEIARIQKEASETLPISDEEIASAIRYRFWDDGGVSTKALHVIVSDGIATLEGHVDNLREKRRAVEICRNIKGLRSGVHRIEVVPVKVPDPQFKGDARVRGVTDIINLLQVQPNTNS